MNGNGEVHSGAGGGACNEKVEGRGGVLQPG